MSASLGVVLFDFGGTLDADGIPWSPRFHLAYRAAGGTLDYAAFDPLFQASDALLGELPGIGALGFRATLEAQVRLLLGLLPDASGIDAGKVVEGFHRDTLRVVDRNRELLERLAGNTRLAVVSNFTGNLRPCLEELGLLKFFAATADSGIVGVTKPDQRIFVELLTRLGSAPDRTWMVGDNFEADIRPAARLGLRTCWLAPPERVEPPGCRSDARIATLPAFERVIG